MIREAELSPNGLYRYSLTRVWRSDQPKVCFIMLNPSTADSCNDDPTIRRCIGYARDWGYGGIIIGNLFAYRATRPNDLRVCRDPVGKFNDQYLEEMTHKSVSGKVVLAWGKMGSLYNRDQAVLKKLLSRRVLFAFGDKGYPRHPLYLPRSLEPVRFSPGLSPL